MREQRVGVWQAEYNLQERGTNKTKSDTFTEFIKLPCLIHGVWPKSCGPWSWLHWPITPLKLYRTSSVMHLCPFFWERILSLTQKLIVIDLTLWFKTWIIFPNKFKSPDILTCTYSTGFLKHQALPSLVLLLSIPTSLWSELFKMHTDCVWHAHAHTT